jgi:putative endonuclease
MGSRQTGRDAETLASNYLIERGLVPVERNFHSRRGEIDLIMTEGECLVFIEVRHRSQATYGSGAETVDARKQERISACARFYLQRHPNAAELPCRFDVIAINGNLEHPHIDWIADAFPAC